MQLETSNTKSMSSLLIPKFRATARVIGSRIFVQWYYNDLPGKWILISVKDRQTSWETRHVRDVSRACCSISMDEPGNYAVTVYVVSGSEILNLTAKIVDAKPPDQYTHALVAVPFSNIVEHADLKVTFAGYHQSHVSVPTEAFGEFEVDPQFIAPPSESLESLLKHHLHYYPRNRVERFSLSTVAVFFAACLYIALAVLRIGAFLLGWMPAPLWELFAKATAHDKYDTSPKDKLFRIRKYPNRFMWGVSEDGHVSSFPFAPWIAIVMLGTTWVLFGQFTGPLRLLNWWHVGFLLSFLVLMTWLFFVGAYDNEVEDGETPLRVRVTMWWCRILSVVGKTYRKIPARPAPTITPAAVRTSGQAADPAPAASSS